MATELPRMIFSLFIAAIFLLIAFSEIGAAISMHWLLCLVILLLGIGLLIGGIVQYKKTGKKLWGLLILGGVFGIFFGLFPWIGEFVFMLKEFLAFIFLGLGVIFFMIGKGIFRRWFLGGLMILLGILYIVSFFNVADVGPFIALMPGGTFHILLLILLGIILALNAFPKTREMEMAF